MSTPNDHAGRSRSAVIELITTVIASQLQQLQQCQYGYWAIKKKQNTNSLSQSCGSVSSLASGQKIFMNNYPTLPRQTGQFTAHYVVF